MGFDKFALSRDLLYFAALFFGAGMGCFLNRWRRGGKTAFRNFTLTAALCLFSAAAAAITAASIISGWMIFRESSLYLPLFVLTALIVMAVRFPRAVGFPFLILLGVFFVWAGFICRSFPLLSDSGQFRLTRDDGGFIRVEKISFSGTEPGSTIYYESVEKDSALEFRAVLFSFSGFFPIVGGEGRGTITEIRSDGKTLHADTPPFWGVPLSERSGDAATETSLKFWNAYAIEEVAGSVTGAVLTVSLEASGFVFR